MSSYPHYTTVLTLISDDIEFPMTLKNIGKFERLNNVSINVYGIEEQKILSLRLADNTREKHVNLLYVQDSRDDNTFLKKSKKCDKFTRWLEEILLFQPK